MNLDDDDRKALAEDRKRRIAEQRKARGLPAETSPERASEKTTELIKGEDEIIGHFYRNLYRQTVAALPVALPPTIVFEDGAKMELVSLRYSTQLRVSGGNVGGEVFYFIGTPPNFHEFFTKCLKYIKGKQSDEKEEAESSVFGDDYIRSLVVGNYKVSFVKNGSHYRLSFRSSDLGSKTFHLAGTKRDFEEISLYLLHLLHQ